MKTYIASTSDDLSEVRQTIAQAVDHWGLEAICYEETFFIQRGHNSHDICLRNIERLDPLTDSVIVIVDRNFGAPYNGNEFPQFKHYTKDQHRYGHLSITWAETALAYELGIWVIPFVYYKTVEDHDEYRRAKLGDRVTDYQPKYLREGEFDPLNKFLNFITHQDKNNWREPYKNTEDLIDRLERKFFSLVVSDRILKRHARKVLGEFKATPICRDKNPLDIFEKTAWFQSRKIREIKAAPNDYSALRECPSSFNQGQEKELLSLLDDREPALLIADAGMGKTMASLYFLHETSQSYCHELAKNQDAKGFSPIWLSEPLQVPDHATISSLIAEALVPGETSDKKEKFTKILLEKGPDLLLIFDALNEKRAGEVKIVDALIAFRRDTNNQRHKILITYRKEQWLSGGSPGLPVRKLAPNEYHVYELLPLHPKQVQAYFRAAGRYDSIDHLNPIQREMACIPLFMYFFQQLTPQEIEGIYNQTQLYQKVLNRWIRVMVEAESGGIRDILPQRIIKELDDVGKICDLEEWIFFILQEFAFEAMKEGWADEFNRERLQHFLIRIEEELEKANNDFYRKTKWIFNVCDTWTLVNIIERSGLIVFRW